MEYLGIKSKTKGEGLQEFSGRGYMLIDATYAPVNEIKSKLKRNEAIMQDYEGLKKDLTTLGAMDKFTPVVLIKANVHELFTNILRVDGFNVINGSTVIPFPSSGQQNNFRRKIKELGNII